MSHMTSLAVISCSSFHTAQVFIVDILNVPKLVGAIAENFSMTTTLTSHLLKFQQVMYIEMLNENVTFYVKLPRYFRKIVKRPYRWACYSVQRLHCMHFVHACNTAGTSHAKPHFSCRMSAKVLQYLGQIGLRTVRCVPAVAYSTVTVCVYALTVDCDQSLVVESSGRSPPCHLSSLSPVLAIICHQLYLRQRTVDDKCM